MARYEYDDGSFVEFSDKWTRGEVKSVFALSGAEYLELLQKKVAAIHLEGDPDIDNPADLAEERLDAVDWQTYLWFADTPIAHVGEMQRLGEAKRRALFATPETAKE